VEAAKEPLEIMELVMVMEQEVQEVLFQQEARQ
jgi:hypothetical protein